MVVLSCAVKNSIACALLQSDGKVIQRSTYHLSADVAGSVYQSLLDVLGVGMRFLKQHVEETGTQEVIIQINNGTVKKWFDKGYAKPEYNTLFSTVYSILDDTPVEYSFQLTDALFAKKFLASKYIVKPAITSSADFFGGLMDDD